MQRLWCLLVGHDDDLRVTPGRLAAECRRCGRVTPGIAIGPLQVATVRPGKGQRHRRARALQRAWLVWQMVEREG